MAEKPNPLDLESVVPFFFSGRVGEEGVEDVPAVPLAIELFLDELYDLLLLGLDPCLLLPESVQFGLPLSNLLAILANIWDP